jgi:hypothetical protein
MIERYLVNNNDTEDSDIESIDLIQDENDSMRVHLYSNNKHEIINSATKYFDEDGVHYIWDKPQGFNPWNVSEVIE